MSERKLVAKWHSFYIDTKRSDRGEWVQITETRPSGHRQSIVLEKEHAEAFVRELLKAVSEIGAAEVDAAEGRPRSYAEWSDDEDTSVRFLYGIGCSISEIALILQRERGAVRSRLRKLGLGQGTRD